MCPKTDGQLAHDSWLVCAVSGELRTWDRSDAVSNPRHHLRWDGVVRTEERNGQVVRREVFLDVWSEQEPQKPTLLLDAEGLRFLVEGGLANAGG